MDIIPLDYVVEPYYMNIGKNSPGSAEFNAFKEDLETNNGIKFFSRVQDVPSASKEDGVKRLAIISARTADNPELFSSCLDIGCDAIFLVRRFIHIVSRIGSILIYFYTFSSILIGETRSTFSL